MCISRKFLIPPQLTRTRLGHEYFQISDFLSTHVQYIVVHNHCMHFSRSNHLRFLVDRENFLLEITKSPFIFRCTGIPSPPTTQSTTSRTSKQAFQPLFSHFSCTNSASTVSHSSFFPQPPHASPSAHIAGDAANAAATRRLVGQHIRHPDDIRERHLREDSALGGRGREDNRHRSTRGDLQRGAGLVVSGGGVAAAGSSLAELRWHASPLRLVQRHQGHCPGIPLVQHAAGSGWAELQPPVHA